MAKLRYSEVEILADCEYATRLEHQGKRMHGGLDAQGNYLPPRSRHRIPAIQAWRENLLSQGHPLAVYDRDAVNALFKFFPNVDQSVLLLRSGAKDAMTRVLTMIGIVEGFGNDGIKLMRPLDMQKFFVESIDGTCLDHLHKGLLTAHGLDEAGNGSEMGHDEMWFWIRDRALGSPKVTDDMYTELPIAPPPGYRGKATAAKDALSVSQEMTRLFPTFDPMLELTLRGLAQVLLIEFGAFATFGWAAKVLGNPEASAEPEWAPRIIGFIQADEVIHVEYVECALAEARARTFLDQNGDRIPGAQVVAKLTETALKRQRGEAMDRMMAYRYRHVRRELEGMPGGDKILDEFKRLGPVPAA